VLALQGENRELVQESAAARAGALRRRDARGGWRQAAGGDRDAQPVETADGHVKARHVNLLGRGPRLRASRGSWTGSSNSWPSTTGSASSDTLCFVAGSSTR
jgi:hypothetical protein